MLKRLILVTLAILSSQSGPLWAADEYLLQPGDQLLISVWREEELQRQVTVLPDGSISYPLAGHLSVKDISAATLEQQIADKLKAYITDPQVSVSVSAASGNVAFVYGQVNRPGPLLMARDLSVVQALATAGGFTPFAKTGRISIIRGQGAESVVLPVDYNAIESRGNLKDNYTLKAGDVIIVP